MRRTELALLLAFFAATVLAAIAGSRMSRTSDMFESRRSTEVSAPMGAKGLALALERLGVAVEGRRRSLFDLAADGTPVDTSELIVLLDLTDSPSAAEKRALRRYVEHGGALFIGAFSQVEDCFGVGISSLRSFASRDSVAVVRPEGVGHIPSPYTGVELLPTDWLESEEESGEEREGKDLMTSGEEEEECQLQPSRADTVLATTDGSPLALRLWFAGGGRVTVLGDSRYLSNRVLKDTDAGALVLPLLLAERPSRIIFDEYHHGFGRRRSLWIAAVSWMLSNPGGWALLQVLAVALLALAVAAVRFGPALSIVERERRSAIEHLDALAVGLERARGRKTAITLIIEGLRRRLSLAATVRRPSAKDLQDWLGALSLAVATPEARGEVERLRSLAQEAGGDDDVLDAALTVEKLWKELGK